MAQFGSEVSRRIRFGAAPPAVGSSAGLIPQPYRPGLTFGAQHSGPRFGCHLPFTDAGCGGSNPNCLQLALRLGREARCSALSVDSGIGFSCKSSCVACKCALA